MNFISVQNTQTVEFIFVFEGFVIKPTRLLCLENACSMFLVDVSINCGIKFSSCLIVELCDHFCIKVRVIVAG